MENKKNMKLAMTLILLAATMSSLGQLAWKIGADASDNKFAYLMYFIGLVAAGIGMVVLMISFRFGEVSILQPMMSVGFALSIIFGAMFLNEGITTLKVVGTLFIIGGSALLGYEGGKDND
ncbi:MULTISPECIES: EamA family transporter [Vagococcus]|uniref:Membrane protein, predicted transporter of cations and cationic drugs n=1 Tax=Vagococcus fluvialis bH819 TaxID=1255619 RepID=A0A1X6WK28_9ENTE|nr:MULTISPECIES: EamA family transporter [Vagococcus]SLM84654.1 Membrane protein, predicted transporter of cations and cationic drugs [Vagococcus fluvialis bH819]